MSKLESWLKTRHKIQALQMTAEHSKSAVAVSEYLSRCIEYALAGKAEDLARTFNVLQTKEREADVLKRRIIDELAKGDLPVTEREDLMRLDRSIDQVIDWMNETGRIQMEFEVAAMPQEVCSIIPTMMKTISNCVLKLDECVFKLTEKQFSDTLNTADAVERLEEDMDALYQRGRGLLGKITSIPVGQAILLSQFLDAMETISDRCEDTCDEIRVIVISLAI